MGCRFGPARWWGRGLLLAAALLLIDPGLETDPLGAGRFAIAAVSRWLRRARSPERQDRGAPAPLR